MLAALPAEIILTAVFLFAILGFTDKRARKGFAGIPIGPSLAPNHLVSTPLNPTRSHGVA